MLIMAKQALTIVPVLVLGESHCTAISRALRHDIQDQFITIDVRTGADASKINFDLFSRIAPRTLVLAFGGTEHNIIGLIEAEPKFDFLWPPFDDLDPARCLIPASAVEQLLHNRMQSALGRAMAVRERFDCPTYAVAPPPPFLTIDEKALLPKSFAGLIEAGIAPAPLRRKLYALQCEVMLRAYKRHGIEMIPAPAGATDEDGYLHRWMWNRDPTHGNRNYGKLVLDHLRNKLDV